MNMIIADLHIHSGFSRACSKSINIENLEKYARIKGVNLLGTGDAQHPKWNKILKKELREDGTGILRSKTDFPFLLSTEISLMYKQNGKGRKIHYVILAKDFDTVDQIQAELLKIGRIDYDGRPIFGMSSPEFIEKIMSISKDIEIIPAHVWTPYFGMFGSKSGFNSIKEACGDQTKHIHSIETGLSSDPTMNWMISELDKYSILSFSDSHSYWPWRIGREATVFDGKMTYKNIIDSIRYNKINSTIEVDPSYGKYHFDGHDKCNVSFDPTKSSVTVCPKCGKSLTLGVMRRVIELANRKYGHKPKIGKDFHKIIPLHEVLSFALAKGMNTKAVWSEYNKLTQNNNEFSILLNMDKKDISQISGDKIADFILKNRRQNLEIFAGFDGRYGKIKK